MKEQELKILIKEVVRECVKEAKRSGKKEPDYEDYVKKKGEFKGISNSNLTPDDKIKFNQKSLPSKTPKIASEAGAISEYDESEEMKLIKGLHLITKKLLGMHKGMDAGKHEEDATNENSGYKLCRGCKSEYESSDLKRGLCPGCRHDQGHDDDATDHAIYKEPSRKHIQPGDPMNWPGGLDENGPQYKVRDGRSYVEQTGKVNRAREIQEDPVINEDEGQYKVRDGTSQVERPGKVNRAREIQKNPKVNENNGGPQYKVVSPNATDTAKEDKAREIQRDPKVSEAAHKVQHRSYKTINDVDQDPKNPADPEVPMSEALTEAKRLLAKIKASRKK